MKRQPAGKAPHKDSDSGGSSGGVKKPRPNKDVDQSSPSVVAIAPSSPAQSARSTTLPGSGDALIDSVSANKPMPHAGPPLHIEGREDELVDPDALISCADIVVKFSKSFQPYFGQAQDSGTHLPKVTLEYPCGSEEYSTHSTPKVASEYSPVRDILNCIKMFIIHMVPPSERSRFGSPSEGIVRQLGRARNVRDLELFVDALQQCNAIMRSLREKQQFNTFSGKVPPYELVNHILHQVYSRVVAPEASMLRNYEAFSNNVYGEVNPILVKEFIERTSMDASCTFIDMGCGTGNVVLQVAAQTGCESHGIEVMDVPAGLAAKQAREFARRIRCYGLSHGSIHIYHGDFLEDAQAAAVLRRADVVLVNNYAFDSDLNQRLMQLFLDLREGTRVISLKRFVPAGFHITERNASSPECILSVEEYPYWSDAVSWTSNGGQYFIQTVDRGPLQKFWHRMENGRTSSERSKRATPHILDSR